MVKPDIVLLNEREVAQLLRVSVATIRRWRLLKRGPCYVKAGASVRYRTHDIEAWLISVSKGGKATLNAD